MLLQEKDNSSAHVEAYKWFGKPLTSQNSQRGGGGVSFLVCDCLMNEVEFSSVKHSKSV